MATYVYKCEDHGLFEHQRGYHDADPTCGECGGAVKRSYGSENPGFSYMGGREVFHNTTLDSRRAEHLRDCAQAGRDPKDFVNVSKAWV
jgi:putative FmdB family regulatory protein